MPQAFPGSETVPFAPEVMAATWQYALAKVEWSQKQDNYDYWGPPALEVHTQQHGRLFEVGVHEALGMDPGEHDPYEVATYDAVLEDRTLGMRWTRNWGTPTWTFPHRQKAMADFYVLGTTLRPASITIVGVATKAQILAAPTEGQGYKKSSWVTWEELSRWDEFRDSLPVRA